MAYRRSIFLINKRFQLKFSFYVCSWLFALSAVYPLIIYSLFDYFVRYASVDPNGPSLTTLHNTREDVIWLLVLLQGIFLTITFLISIFVSHRIAGPIYKLHQFFEEAKRGNFDKKLFFRKKDHFQELAEDYNAMIETVKKRVGGNPETFSSSVPKLIRAIDRVDGDTKRDLQEVLAAIQGSKS